MSEKLHYGVIKRQKYKKITPWRNKLTKNKYCIIMVL